MTPVSTDRDPLPLFDDLPHEHPRVRVGERHGRRVLFVDDRPVSAWDSRDVAAEDHAVCCAVEAGLASIADFVVLLGRSQRTLHRSLANYRKGGAAALVRKKGGYAKGSRRDPAEEHAIRSYYAQGMNRTAIAKATGRSVTHISNTIKRLGLDDDSAQTTLLDEPRPSEDRDEPVAEPIVDAVGPEEPALDLAPALPVEAGDVDAVIEPPAPIVAEKLPASPFSLLSTRAPAPRTLERLLAYQGKLHDAPPRFVPGRDLPHVGALLAIPGIVRQGLVESGQRLYPAFGPAFYGVRTTLVCLVLLYLLRIQRPENLKEWSPVALGRVLGLDRVPEVDTLRLKLRTLAAGPIEALRDGLVRRRIARGELCLARLYVDGHVRVYTGKYDVPSTHVAQRRIACPAAQDVWVHDALGRPILAVTQEAHPPLTDALPPILDHVEDVCGGSRPLVVFDRGGFSPKLFRELVARGYSVLTYRKGKGSDLLHEVFVPFRRANGRAVEIADVCLYVGAERVPMRQITVRQGAHRTEILTTDHESDATVLAEAMFARWKQENYFKYMVAEYAFDALAEYGVEADDPLRELPNPAWRTLDNELRAARRKLGAALVRGEGGEALAREVEALRARRDALPRRVRVADLDDAPVRLPARRRMLVDTLKTTAWHIETGLVEAVGPHWSRADDDARTLVAAALRSSGHLDIRGDELHVTLAPQATPARTRALVALCRALDATCTVFPGTRLTMRFAVDEAAQWALGA